MSSPLKHELVIIGAGAAGLLLLLALKQKNFAGKVTLLERNNGPINDRIWSFWFEQSIPQYLQNIIEYKWPGWHFSTATFSRQMFYERHPYCAIRANALSLLAREALEKCSRFSILYNCEVLDIHTSGKNSILNTALGQLTATQVIDTRPPPLHFKHQGLFQCFYGQEVSTEQDTFDVTSVALMKDLKITNQGIEFIYILPFSARHALIELTCFSINIIDTHALKNQLQPLLAKMFAEQTFSVVREEAAVLPMYQVNLNHGSKPAAVIYGGIAGGALRPATGYSFLNCQRWADATANQLIRHTNILAIKPVGHIYQLLDAMFLRVLRAKPELSVDLYTHLFCRIAPEVFIRFMSERATGSDLVKVIWAMPKWTFIIALLKSYLWGKDSLYAK